MKMIFLCSQINQIGGIQQYNRQFLKVLDRIHKNVLLVERGPGFLGKIKFVSNFFWKAISCQSDIVICGHINFSPIVYLLNLFLNQKFIIIVHGVEAWNIKSRFQLIALKKAKLIVAVSMYTRDKILRQLPCIKEKIFILPNSVDERKFFIKEKSEYLMEKHKLFGSKVILTVARLSGAEVGFKGYDRIIESLPNILEKIPNVKYLLVGDGDDLPRIRQLVENLELGGQIILVGTVGDNEIVDYYNLADVFVMPSRCEGFGIVFLEALACGVPVIAGNKDASREAILGGKLGQLINPDNRDDICEAIILTLSGKMEMKEKKDLRKAVLENYGLDKFRTKVFNLLHELQR